MGLFSKDIKNLEDLYQPGLKDIYYAENQIVKSLPDMIENATNAELKRGLQHHLRETKEQVKRLEQVFALHGEQPSGTKCPAIDGIIKEGGDLMGEVEDKAVLNVGIIAAAQAVEHYEITRYGALIAWARELGHGEDATILARNLKEEKAADKTLTAIAERRANPGSARRRAGKRAGAGASHPHRAKAKPQRAAASHRKPAQKKKRRRGASPERTHIVRLSVICLDRVPQAGPGARHAIVRGYSADAAAANIPAKDIRVRSRTAAAPPASASWRRRCGFRCRCRYRR